MRHPLMRALPAVLALSAQAIYAQPYPSKPIRVVTAESGGASDLLARLIANGISGPLGQPVVIDNRMGGILLAEVIAKAPPDGYNLLIYSGTIWVGPLLREKMPYDPIQDFSPVTLVSRAPSIVVIHPSVGAKTIKDLIAIAKAKPGVLNYGSTSTGGASHLATELFKAMASVDILRIPYKSSTIETTDLLSGQTHLSFGTVNGMMPHVKLGKLKALAVTSAQPSPLAPGLPTVAATGVPGYEAVVLAAMMAPAKTPDAILNRLSQETVRFLKSAEARDRLFASGVDAVGSTPDELTATIKAEVARWGKVIKDAGIRAN
jgi:tripartite-type tricarboxylate transporter receptor subunit TctC